jgi:hypothetical protein
LAADVTPATLHAAFEQDDNLHSGQVRVQLARNAVKPSVDAFTGTRRRGQQIVKELWKLACHSAPPFSILRKADSTLDHENKIRRPIRINGIFLSRLHADAVPRDTGIRRKNSTSSMMSPLNGAWILFAESNPSPGVVSCEMLSFICARRMAQMFKHVFSAKIFFSR